MFDMDWSTTYFINKLSYLTNEFDIHFGNYPVCIFVICCVIYLRFNFIYLLIGNQFQLNYNILNSFK